MHNLAKALLDLGFRPKRQFGQNFLFDENFLAALVRDAELSTDDVVVEFGTGPGQLTEKLAAAARHVVSIEIDPRLHAFATGRLSLRNVDFILGDALPGGNRLHPDLLTRVAELSSGRPVRVVSNFPYAVGGAILLALAEGQIPARDAVGTLQSEVADRLCAAPGEDAYGPLGILLTRTSDVRRLRDVPPQLFWPMPSIDSALVRVDFGRRPFGTDWPGYKDFVKAIFGFRRKTLGAGMKRLGRTCPEAWRGMRPEALSPSELEAVWRG